MKVDTYENLSFHTVLAICSRLITPRIVSLIAPHVALKSTILGFKDIFQIALITNCQNRELLKKWQCRKWNLKKDTNEW